MSKLSQLALKIRSLPKIDDERIRLRVVRQVCKDANDVSNGLAIVLKQAPYIDSMTNGGVVAAVDECLSFSITQAKRLKRMIQRASFGSEEKISEHLENLKKKKQAAETQKENAWAKVQSEVNSVETILGIAANLKLDSVPVLQSAVGAFKKVTLAPPTSTVEVDAVLVARKQIKGAVSNSGLEGNVKKILEGAIAANGDAKLLLEPDVQKFLKEHPSLWSSLKLKLA